MDSENPTLQLWETHLAPGVTSMLRDGKSLSYSSYMEHMAMYTAAYNWCSTGTTLVRHAHSHQLHTQISDFSAEYTRGILAHAPTDETLVPEYYDEQWDRFWRGARALDRLFTFLNKHHVKRLRDEGNKTIKTVGNMALEHCKTNVFETLVPRLETALGAGSARLETVHNSFADGDLMAANFEEMHVRPW
ncbi:hypothetical protein C8R43DRAFT_1040552 [Mycena crocata]|nr:hypothetical protein C8R43DRAFT_1040552 [Mycena crocata]